MNLINAINAGQYDIKKLSDIYFDRIVGVTKKYAENHGEPDEKTYMDFSDNNSELDHLEYREFVKLYKYTIPNDELEENNVEETKKITNRALYRRLSQDMHDEEVLNISTKNFEMLKYLEYDGEPDKMIPEIVRGNYMLYLECQDLIKENNICHDAIDRMRLFITELEDNRPKGKIGKILCSKPASKEVQEYLAQTVLSPKTPISIIRRSLARYNISPYEDYREKHLQEFHARKFAKVRNNMDVYNIEDKLAQAMLSGTSETNSKNYEIISDNGYNGKTKHPLIRCGYHMYVEKFVLEKTVDESIQVLEDLSNEMKPYEDAISWLNGDTSGEYVDSVHVLFMEDYWRKAKKDYKNGKITKEEYDEFKEARNDILRKYPDTINHGIGHLKNSKSVAEFNDRKKGVEK